MVIVALFSMLLSSAQQETLELSVEQAEELALLNNYALKNAKLDIENAEHQVKEITSMGLPQVKGSAAFMHNYKVATQLIPGDFIGQPGSTVPVQFGVPFSMNATAQLNQLLFDGTFFLGLQAASEFVNINRLLASQSEIGVKEGVRKAYYMALISQDNIKQLEQSIENINKLKSETEAMYKAGIAEKLDVDRLILSSANLEININNLKQQADIAKKVLLNSMGYDVNRDVVLISKLPSFTPENFMETYGVGYSPTERIELKILNQQQELNELNLRRWKMGYVPSLYGTVNYGAQSFAAGGDFNNLGKDWFGNGMYAVSLNVPIFDGFQKKAIMDQVRVDIAKTKNSLAQATNGINLEVSQARTEYNSAYKALDLQKKSLELAKTIYNTTSIKFKEGVGSSFEMITAESDLTTANTNYLNALYQLNVAKINLDKALGRL